MPLSIVQLCSWLASIGRARHDDGTSVVEYALLLGLIAIVAVVAVGFVGDPVSQGLSAGGQGFAAP